MRAVPVSAYALRASLMCSRCPPSRHASLERVRIGPIANVQQYDELMMRLAHLGFSGAKLAQD